MKKYLKIYTFFIPLKFSVNSEAMKKTNYTKLEHKPELNAFPKRPVLYRSALEWHKQNSLRTLRL